MNIIISNPQKVTKIKAQIKKEGHQNIHILSDFDRTLTYGTFQGEKTPSIISMLRDGHHLTEGYAEKAHKLFNQYHPIEIDPDISLPEKKSKMREWWNKHYQLLIKSGLSKGDIEDIVKNGHMQFRKGVAEFLDLLHQYNLPLVILSASGCGDAIQIFFQNIQKDYSNIFYVTNRFVWDNEGRAVAPKKPVIHCMNKDEMVLEKISNIYSKIKNRRNVILLGDSLGDLGMIEGFSCKHFLKIGFLNLNCDKLRAEYKENFDIVLESDGDFDYINRLMQELIN